MAGSGVVPITAFNAMNYIFAGGGSAEARVGSGGVRVHPFDHPRAARTARYQTVVSRASATIQLPHENRVSVPIRVLILEDLEDDAILLVHELRRQGYAPTYRRVDTAVDMYSALAQEPWDIILADFSMPGFDTLQALELLHDVGLDLPYIVV